MQFYEQRCNFFNILIQLSSSTVEYLIVGVDKEIKTSGKVMDPIKQPWNNIPQKLAINALVPKDMSRVELQNFKDLSNYKIFVCLPACLPAVRPNSTGARTPDFSDDHCKIVAFMNLLF